MLSSLRVRLVAWLLLPLSALVAVCGGLSWDHATELADYVQDHDLLSSAKVLSDRLIWEGDDIRATVPPSALSLFMSPAHDRVFLRVTDADGRLLAGSPDVPLPAVVHPAGPDDAQWYDAVFDTLPVRVVLMRRAMYETGGARQVSIVVAKTTHSHDLMRNALWRPTMEYLLIALLLTVLVSILALTWELRPILRLRQQLASHDPLRLDLAVDTRELHTELRPVAETVNRFVRQLQAHSAAQRRFIADAAHQLRTPLALQATQIAYARHTREARQNWDTRRADMDGMWLSMQASNRRLVDVTNKLLLLARAEHADAQKNLERVDLAAVALGCIEQLAAIADRRCIDLGLDAPAAAWVTAQPALLDALVGNLLDNALRYTQEGGRVTVSVNPSEGRVALLVEDNGPGIPAEAREQVFERFFRIASDTEGTGLGLPIVREIARSCDATVQLDAASPDGRSGLRVTVLFPAWVPSTPARRTGRRAR